jgi:hypothetical protein
MSDKRRGLKVVNQGESEGAGLGRRRLLQGLVAGMGAGVALPGSAEAHPMDAHAKHSATVAAAQAKAKSADWKPEFLDEHGFATLTALCERIVPGSVAAGTDRFIDSLLAVDSRDDQRRFLSQIGAIDGEANARFRLPFRSLSEPQQIEILKAVSTPPAGAPEGSPRPGRGSGPVTLFDHFNGIKRWITSAYYSSEAGLKELGYTGQMFHAGFPGCTHPEHS